MAVRDWQWWPCRINRNSDEYSCAGDVIVVEKTIDRDGCNVEYNQGVLEGRYNSWKIV